MSLFSSKKEIEKDAYKSHISDMAKKKLNSYVSSKGQKSWQARHLIKELFNNSKYVKIYTGDLSEEFYKHHSFIDSLERFLRGGGNLELLVHNPDQLLTNEELCKTLKYYMFLYDSISIKSTKKRITQLDHESYYFLGDDCVCFEQSNIKNPSDMIGSFNDVEKTGMYLSIFKQLFNDKDSLKVILK